MRWLIAAFLLLALVEPALSSDQSRCVDAKAPAAMRMAACTHAVETSPTAQAYIDRAGAHRDAMQWDEARADLDKALTLDPRNVRALSLRAAMHAVYGDAKAAIADLDRAIAIRPDAALYAQRGDVWVMTDDKRAVAEYTKALLLEPKNVATLTARAEAYVRLDQDPLARDDYDRALEIEPRDPLLFVGRGRVFRKQFRKMQALDDFTTAIKLDPDFLPAYRERAQTYVQHAEFTPAIADFNRILAAKPKDADALRARRRAYLEVGDSAHAIADAERIVAVAKYLYAEDYLERGVAYLRRGGDDDFTRAERTFKQAAAFERGHERGATAFVKKFCAIFCGARRSGSIAALLLAAAPSRKKLDHNRNIADADAYMGMLALKRGDDGKAAAIFAEALEHSSRSAVAYYGRGVVKHNAGDIEGAKDDFATSRDHNGNMHLLYARAGIEPVPAQHATFVEPIADAAGSARDIGICQRGDDVAPTAGATLDFAAEIDACTRVVRAKPAKEVKALAYANRARWRAMKSDRDGAIDDYNAALTVDPGNVNALIAIGGYLTEQRKYDAAIAAFDRAATADPKSFNALFGRCEARAAQGDAKSAVADCDQAVAAAGDDPRVKVRRAPVLLRAGENKRALRDYDLVLREAARYGLPDDPDARFGRAVALKRLGDTAGAEIDFKKARAQDPTIDRQFAELGIKP